MDNQGYPERRYVVTALMRYIVAAVLFVILVGLFAWFFFFRGTNDTDNKAAESGKSNQSSSQQVTDKSSNNKNNSTTNKNSDNKSTSTQNTNASSDGTSTNNQSGSSSSSEELANTGPGDVVVLFAVAVLAGTGFRWYQLRRQLNR
jgi:cytoskeletal protein RodZ